jgi:hypothetical protein
MWTVCKGKYIHTNTLKPVTQQTLVAVAVWKEAVCASSSGRVETS